MQFVRKRRRQPFINIISLIDILVVLLIFYIATTVFKTRVPRIVINTAHAHTATTTQDNIPSTIYVTADSKVYLDDTPIDPDQLGGLLKTRKAGNPSFKIATKLDQNAPWKIVVKVIDACNEAGIPDISAYTSSKAAAAPGGTP